MMFFLSTIFLLFFSMLSSVSSFTCGRPCVSDSDCLSTTCPRCDSSGFCVVAAPLSLWSASLSFYNGACEFNTPYEASFVRTSSCHASPCNSVSPALSTQTWCFNASRVPVRLLANATWLRTDFGLPTATSSAADCHGDYSGLTFSTAPLGSCTADPYGSRGVRMRETCNSTYFVREFFKPSDPFCQNRPIGSSTEIQPTNRCLNDGGGSALRYSCVSPI